MKKLKGKSWRFLTSMRIEMDLVEGEEEEVVLVEDVEDHEGVSAAVAEVEEQVGLLVEERVERKPSM